MKNIKSLYLLLVGLVCLPLQAAEPFLEVAGWKAAGGDRNGRTVVVYNQT